MDSAIKTSSSASRDGKMSLDTMQIYDDVARLERELGVDRKMTNYNVLQRRHDPSEKEVFIIDFGTDEVKYANFPLPSLFVCFFFFFFKKKK